jgi:hypothetical protein
VIRHIGPSPAVVRQHLYGSTNHGTPDTGDPSPIHVAFVRQPSSAARASWVFLTGAQVAPLAGCKSKFSAKCATEGRTGVNARSRCGPRPAGR